jgi:hypothetical protein
LTPYTSTQLGTTGNYRTITDLHTYSPHTHVAGFSVFSLLEYELAGRGIELSGVFGIDSCRIMARKKLDLEKKTSYVIRSDSETVINPLPGYD